MHYFDHAATTRCSDEAFEAIRSYTLDDYGNPSSSHRFGQEAFRAVEQAREKISKIFNTRPEGVLFTGSGSEANNLAICGRALACTPTKRIIVSALEHPAAKEAALSLLDNKYDVKICPSRSDGTVDQQAMLELINDETVLVSVMAVNNITGVIQPIEDLVRSVKNKNESLMFHSDFVQGLGKITPPSGVDLFSISAHKVEGPKGIGALVATHPKVFSSKQFRPIIWGGGQEYGLRSGTQNPALIAAFGCAAEIAQSKYRKKWEHCMTLRAELIHGLKDVPLIHWNSPHHAVPHIVSLSLPGLPISPVARLIEDEGYMISTGSACSSSKKQPDTVLVAMGKTHEVCCSGLRISFSDTNTLEEVRGLVQAIMRSLERVLAVLGDT